MQQPALGKDTLALLSSLSNQRAHVLGILEGLPGEALRRQVLPSEDVFGLYRHETELADAIIAATPLDAVPAWWPAEIFPDLPPRSLRDTILHVITETACHAGHLDVVRELIDGKTWQVLT